MSDYLLNLVYRIVSNQFNLETDEVEAFKSAAKYWRNACVTEDPAPPLIIEIFLDASELVATQSVILVDERRLKHKLELNKVGRFYQLDKTVAAPKKTLLLESWCLLLSGPQGCQLELPTIYKLGISYFRSLQSFLKILPAASLHQRLKKSKRYGLKIGYRLSTTVSSIDSEIGFASLNSVRKLRFAVTFRRLCDFHVEDSEMLLSARFQRGEDSLDAPLHLPSRNPFSYRTAQDSYAFGNFDKGSGTEDISQYHVQNRVGAGFPFPAQPYTDSTSPGRSRNREVGTRSRPSSQDQDNFLGSKGSLGVAVFSSVKSSPPSHLASLRRPPSITMFSPFKSPSLSSSPSLHNASPPSRTSSFGNRSSTSLERGLFQPSNRVTPPSIRPTSPAPTKVSSSFGYRFGSFSGNPLSGEPGVPHSSSFRRTPSMRPGDTIEPPAIKANIKPADAAPDLSFGKTLLDRYKQFQLRFEALTTELEACAAKSRLGLGPLLESPATSPLRKTGFKAEPSSSEA
ncbi:autophagy protein 13, partial [Massospora cicadina]